MDKDEMCEVKSRIQNLYRCWKIQHFQTNGLGSSRGLWSYLVSNLFEEKNDIQPCIQCDGWSWWNGIWREYVMFFHFMFETLELHILHHHEHYHITPKKSFICFTFLCFHRETTGVVDPSSATVGCHRKASRRTCLVQISSMTLQPFHTHQKSPKCVRQKENSQWGLLVVQGSYSFAIHAPQKKKKVRNSD